MIVRSRLAFAGHMHRKRLVALSGVLALLGAGAVVVAAPAAAAPETASNYEICVVPSGATEPPGCDQVVSTLSAAQAAVQANNGSQDVTVELATATYNITAPLTFGSADGGQNGHYVTWQAAPGATPVISGGEQVTGWTNYGGTIYEANVGVGTNTRNLYVNGVEAPVAGSPLGGSAAASLASVTTTGFTVTNTTLKSQLAAATDVTQMQIEHRGSWTDHFCPVASITNSGGTINMAQPCWKNNIMGWDTGRSTNGDYIENNLTFLNKAGEYYLDSSTGTLYYYAAAGTTLGQMNDSGQFNVELPLTESILDVSGTHASPVENLTFQGITFKDSSWLLPSQPGGYADQQQNYFSFLDYATTMTTANGYPANYSYPGGNGSSTGAQFEATRRLWYEDPGAIQVSAAHGVTFAGNTFTDLGSAGLAIGEDAEDMASGVPYDSQNITVANNSFSQIAATGIMIGGINYPAASDPADPAYNNKDILVENNHITTTGTNYLDSDGVQTNNTTHAVITNNLIDNIPYDGIGTGFGWGAFDPGGSADYNNRGLYTPANYPSSMAGSIVPTTATPQQYSVVTNNVVDNTGKGASSFACCAGPFYNLSEDPFGVFTGNYMYGNNPAQGGFYEDEGSRFNTYYDNVIQDATSWAGVNSYSNNNSDDNLYTGNWYNHNATVNGTTDTGSPHYNVVYGNVSVSGTNWPAAAQDVINKAGIEPGLGYPAPSITTMPSATMTVGSSSSYSLYASGSPTPTFSEQGALPSGVSFTDNNDGTATFSGTPASGAAGTYTVSVTASNGVGQPSVQDFTLTVLAQSPTSTTEAITGKVTDAATGAPLANVCAYVYFTRTASTPSYSACTKADGSYEMDGVVPNPLQPVNSVDTSHYLVQFVDPAGYHATQWYNNTPGGAATESGGNAIQLQGQLGTAVTSINAAMGVTGKATTAFTSQASGTFVAGLPHSVTVSTSGYPTAALTESGTLPQGLSFVDSGDGTATISGTAASDTAGQYKVTISADNGSGNPASQTFTITVLDKSPTPTTAAIGGLISDSSSGNGLSGACVYLYPAGSSSSAAYATCARSDGFYELGDIAPGSYNVAFTGPSGSYTTQWFTGSAGGATSQADAATVTLSAGQAKTPINAALVGIASGNVSGTVTASGGSPVQNVCVYLYPAGGGASASYATCSASDGTYYLGGVTPGSYDVAFYDAQGRYLSQWFDGASGGAASESGATAVSVPSGNGTVTGVDAVEGLVPSGNVSGVVHDTHGDPLSNICVYVYPASGGSSSATAATCTASDGSYWIGAVASGSYDVAFYDPAGQFVTQWYFDSATQAGGQAVTVPNGGATASGVNAVLSTTPSGTIAGAVTDSSSSAAVGGDCVYLYPHGVSSAAAYATCTQSDGTYQLSGVTAGAYDVAFFDPQGRYVTRWYDGSASGAASQSGAVAVSVPNGGQTLAGVNVAVPPVAYGNVAGTVTDAGTSAPLGNICVYLYPGTGSSIAAYSSCTLADGTYQVSGVAAGTYQVAFYDPNGNYATQWYTGSATQAGAQTITVNTGNQTVTGINAALSSGV